MIKPSDLQNNMVTPEELQNRQEPESNVKKEAEAEPAGTCPVEDDEPKDDEP